MNGDNKSFNNVVIKQLGTRYELRVNTHQVIKSPKLMYANTVSHSAQVPETTKPVSPMMRYSHLNNMLGFVLYHDHLYGPSPLACV